MVERLIQQALHRSCSHCLGPSSRRTATAFVRGDKGTAAVQAAQGSIRAGQRWVVDLISEKFFDRVNHDVLSVTGARRVSDARVLK